MTKEKPTTWKRLSFQEQCRVAEKAKRGDVWIHNKSERSVEILCNTGAGVRLKHASGRITVKQLHYFAYDYSPQA